MSHLARMQTLTRTSQSQRRVRLLLVLASPGLEPCISPSTPSPNDGFFAWRRVEKCAEPFGAVYPRPASVAGPDRQRPQRLFDRLIATASLYRRPSGKCFHRAPSLPYFPCSPSVTRFSAYPAPCGTARLCFFGFQKIFSTDFRKERGRKRFPEPSENASLGLGSGAPRLMSVPRAFRANTNKEKHNGTLRISYVELGRF
jgi:hypothetical protein